MAAMAKATFSPTPSRLVRWRTWIQAAFLLVWLDPLAVAAGIYGLASSRLASLPAWAWPEMLRLHNVCGPVFHCYACPLATFACPIGVLANFSALHTFPFLAVGTLILVSGIFAGFVCGWACPFGFLQDLVGRIPAPKFRLPAWTGHFRYGVLAILVVAVPFLWGEGHPLFICRVCPAGAIEGAMVNVGQAACAGKDIPWPSALKITILVLFFGAMFIKWRPWCTLLCPLGAIFGFFNRFSAVYLQFHHDQCSQCGRCSKVCPHGRRADKQSGDPTCIRCMECTRCSAITVETILSRPGKP
jgi:polyferredoxin